ncbi:MAG: hypothetical protein R2853_09740 [Thermomicrobiales bacterium]
MSPTPRPDGRPPQLVPLHAQEQADAAALARYWDARLQGRPGPDTEVEPELRDMVRLLEHYRDAAGPVVSPPVATSPLRRSAHRAALVMLAAAILLFASNTLLSPRSWLLSSAADPDWIPWVSDDWLGSRAAAAGSMVSQLVTPLAMAAGFPHGA